MARVVVRRHDCPAVEHHQLAVRAHDAGPLAGHFGLRLQRRLALRRIRLGRPHRKAVRCGVWATAATTAMALPTHDTLGVAGAVQGMAGMQRSFFHLLAARGGAWIEGKAEQRSAIVAMQSRPLDAAMRTMFEQLGTSLAQFVTESGAYLPFQLTHVEAGGKLTDAASGEVMLTQAGRCLAPYGISVRRANESEFGQALAMAECARDAPVGGVE